MDKYALAESDVRYLDMDIREYVQQVIPMLLPMDASKEEREKLERILFQVTALNVYNTKIDILFSKFNERYTNPSQSRNNYLLRESPDIEALKVWNQLEKTKPYMPLKYKVLKRCTNSRYTKRGEWHDNHNDLAERDSRRLVTEYAKRSWRKTSIKNLLEYSKGKTQLEAIFSLRDFFHNGGNLSYVNMDSKEYQILEEVVKQMRVDLVNKRFNMDFVRERLPMPNPIIFSEKYQIEKDHAYITACENARKFMEINKLLAYSKSAVLASQHRKERKLTKNEYAVISERIINLFDKEFSNLPVNENEHQERLNIIFEDMSRYLSHFPGMQLTNKEQYKKLMEETYKKYMTQLKTHTLPIRLSYFPEDKEMYAKIVKEARKAQVNERRYGKPQMSGESALLLSYGSVLAVGLVTMECLCQGNYAIPVTEGIAAVSALIINKVCEHRRLTMDVEKRIGIRQKRIIQVRGFKSPAEMRKILDEEKKPKKYYVPEAYKRKVETFYKSQEQTVPVGQFEGVSVEYYENHSSTNTFVENKTTEVTSNQRRRRADRYKLENTTSRYKEISRENVSQPIISNTENHTQVRRRRVDKYKNEYNNSDPVEL